MNRLALPLAVLFLAVSTPVLTADQKAITEAVRMLDGEQAGFVQRFLPRGYKKDQVETGTVVFGKAPASRWSYDTPEAKTFVFDGETSWMYVPADETVMVHRVSDEEKNKLPFFVLSDPTRMTDWYEIEETGGGLTKLTAKDADALLRTIEIEIGSNGRLERLMYTDGQGNRTTFELSNWTKAEANDETFTFTPPVGVDVIQN